jgi:hypothetical protein
MLVFPHTLVTWLQATAHHVSALFISTLNMFACGQPEHLRDTGADMTDAQLMENARQYSGRSECDDPRKSFDWRSLLRIRWRRDDKESIICYFLFMALFVADFSALSLVFPVVLYCYALLAQTPARHFWQVGRCHHIVISPMKAGLSLFMISGTFHIDVALHEMRIMA